MKWWWRRCARNCRWWRPSGLCPFRVHSWARHQSRRCADFLGRRHKPNHWMNEELICNSIRTHWYRLSEENFAFGSTWCGACGLSFQDALHRQREWVNLRIFICGGSIVGLTCHASTKTKSFWCEIRKIACYKSKKRKTNRKLTNEKFNHIFTLQVMKTNLQWLLIKPLFWPFFRCLNVWVTVTAFRRDECCEECSENPSGPSVPVAWKESFCPKSSAPCHFCPVSRPFKKWENEKSER